MPYSPALLLALATLFWGGNIVLGKAVSGIIPPITLSYVRWALALILLLPICWQEIKQHFHVLIDRWHTFALLGVTGLMGFNMCVYTALQYTTAINAGLINAFSPAYVMLISLLFLKDKIFMRQWLGIFISFIGTLWIVIKGQVYLLRTLDFNQGDLIILLGIFMWGIYSLVLKTKAKAVQPNVLLVFSIFMGLVFTSPIFIYENINLSVDWINGLEYFHYLSFLYFSIFPTIIAFLFFNYGILQVGPGKASIYMSLIPVFTIILSILFLKEGLTYSHIVGGSMVILGVYLTYSYKNV